MSVTVCTHCIPPCSCCHTDPSTCAPPQAVCTMICTSTFAACTSLTPPPGRSSAGTSPCACPATRLPTTMPWASLLRRCAEPLDIAGLWFTNKSMCWLPALCLCRMPPSCMHCLAGAGSQRRSPDGGARRGNLRRPPFAGLHRGLCCVFQVCISPPATTACCGFDTPLSAAVSSSTIMAYAP